MKVSSDQNLISTSGQPVSDTGSAVSVKNFNDLKTGDTFKARIVDIQPNQVTIKLDSGNLFTAKSQVPPEARIGEDSIFLVKESFKGQILLEMIRPGANMVQSNAIRDALFNAGLFPSEENMLLAKELIDAELPIDSQTLQKAAFFNYSGNTGQRLGIDGVLMLLQENFPLSERNVDMLNGILEKTVRLQDNLSGMIEELLKIEDTVLLKELLHSIPDGSEETHNNTDDSRSSIHGSFVAKDADSNVNLKISELKAQLLLLAKSLSDTSGQRETNVKEMRTALHKVFFIDLKQEGSLKDLTQLYTTLYESVSKMLDVAQSAGIKNDLVNQLANLRDGIEFMNHIDRYKEYMQIPFSIDGRENNGELYIFKDGKHGKKNYEQASVLIALDCNYLGHIEAFINKIGNNLNMQFRGDRETSLKLIVGHASELSSVLAEKGFSMSCLTVKKAAEAFTITDIPVIEKKEAPKRYTFDIRV